MAALFRGSADSGAVDACGHEFGEPRCRAYSRHTRHRSVAATRRGGSARSALSVRHRRAPSRSGLAAGGADDAFILLTSGTTSRPKMVPLTHASVCLSAYNAGAALALGPRGPVAERSAAVPCTWPDLGAADRIGGRIKRGLHARLRCRGLLRLADGVSTDLVHGGSDNPSGVAVGGEIATSTTSSGHSLRLIRSASASLPPDVLSGLESLFGVPVIETYGMTEAASQIAANPLERRKPGSVGQPAGARDRDHGRARADGLPTGERGEIVLRGPTITRGYDNDAAATEAAFRDGWFRTGDLGYLDRGRISLHCWPHQGRHQSGRAEGRARRGRRGLAEPSGRDRSRRFPSSP